MQPWTPEPLLFGKTVFVLGNGPSLAAADLSMVDPVAAIAINAAVEILPAAAFLFARDASWCLGNLSLIRSYRGIAVTTNRRAAISVGMRCVLMDRRDDFPPVGAPAIRYGVSSGHAAVSLAVAMGAARIVLLGFDGRAVEGRTHWHARYSADPHIYPSRFNPAWKGWAKSALARGCKIVNATKGSAIVEFEHVDVAVKDGFTTDDMLPGDQVEGVNEWIDGGPKSRLVEMRLIRNGRIIAVSRPKAAA